MDQASKNLENILKNLDEKDLLFNYLSLFKNTITLDWNGKPCYDFSKSIGFHEMSDYLKRPIFSYFIIYKKKEKLQQQINDPTYLFSQNNEFHHNQKKETLCFTHPFQLNNFCFIDSKAFSFLKNCFFQIPYAMSFMLHEVPHLYTGETIKFLVSAYHNKLGSPFIEGVNFGKKGESGELLEYFITPV